MTFAVARASRSDCLGDPQQPPPPRVHDDGREHEEGRNAREDKRHPEVLLQRMKRTGRSPGLSRVALLHEPSSNVAPHAQHTGHACGLYAADGTFQLWDRRLRTLLVPALSSAIQVL